MLSPRGLSGGRGMAMDMRGQIQGRIWRWVLGCKGIKLLLPELGLELRFTNSFNCCLRVVLRVQGEQVPPQPMGFRLVGKSLGKIRL